MPVPDWPEEHKAMVREYWPRKDISAGTIALKIFEAYGELYSKNAIIGKAHRMGLPRRGRERTDLVPGNMTKRGKPAPERKRPFTPLKVPLKINSQNHTIAPAPSQPMAPEPKPQLIIPIGQRCSLIELEDDKCHWPIGDPHNPDFYFCGGKAVMGLPYCGYHARIAYGPREAR